MPAAMVLFAHPDDEVIALGARLSRFTQAAFVYATDGAPRDMRDSHAHGFSTLAAYREARQGELRQALALAGISDPRHDCLGFADQESGLHLAELTRAVLLRLRRYTPEAVFTHPYEGGHPDHDACAFAVRAAVDLLAHEGASAPVILEAAFYHAGLDGIATGEFLAGNAPTPVRYALSGAEAEQKRALLASFITQQDTLQYFPLDHETFRVAPAYDFTVPPHAGQTFYDRFDWGMRSARFCQLAAEALAELRSTPVLA